MASDRRRTDPFPSEAVRSPSYKMRDARRSFESPNYRGARHLRAREGEGECIRSRLCAANKQIRRVHERHGVYKAGVVRRVNTGPTREGNARVWSVNRAVLKRRIAIYGRRSLCALRQGEQRAERERGRRGAENRFDTRSITRRG